MNSRNTAKLSHPYFENLNGLRAIGALSVFLFHGFLLGNEMWGTFSGSEWFTLLSKVMSKGNYGVSLFFVLSGFLITYLLMHEAQFRGKIDIGSFFMRRLLRIWPVFFLVVLFGFVIYPILPGGIQTQNSPWMYSFFLSNFEEIRVGFNDPVNFLTITWSVSIEEQFYISWVVLMAFLPFLRKGKGILPLMVTLILGSLVFRWMHRSEEITLYYHTLAVMSDLALGGLLAWFTFHWRIQDKLNKIPMLVNVLIYSCGILGIIGTRVVFRGDLIVIEKLVLGVFFAYVIFDQAFGKHSLFKVDKVPGLYRLGEISYGFYMYHCIVIYYVQYSFAQAGWTDSLFHFMLFLLTSFALSYLLSLTSYQLMEKPILRLKKFFQK